MFGKDSGLLQGTLELLVLKTLSWGPMHGYGIASWIESATDDVLRVEEGSLYPALHRAASIIRQKLGEGVEEVFVGRGRLQLDEPPEVAEHVFPVRFEVFEGAVQLALPPFFGGRALLTPESVTCRVAAVHEQRVAGHEGRVT